jgi:hypothetical protein
MNTKLFVAASFLTLLTTSAVHAQDLVLESHTVRDPMAVNQDAVTFLKPKGWKVSGGVKWYVEGAHQACLEIKVANPNGLEQVESLPWCYATWLTNPIVPMKIGSNYLGSVVHPVIEDPAEVIRKFTVPAQRGKYQPRMTAAQEMPEIAKVLSKMLGGAKVRSARVRIEYQSGGQMVEEDFYLSIFVVSMDLGNNCTSYIWGPAWPPFALRAAKGKLDAETPKLLSIVNSSQVNPKWFAEYLYVCDLFQNRMNQGIANAKAISDTVTRNSNEIFKMYSDSYWKRQASQAKINQQFSDYIRGVQTWQCPQHKYPVQLPSGYQYAWVSSSGTYILSNNAGFDPNVGSTMTWTSLKQAK